MPDFIWPQPPAPVALSALLGVLPEKTIYPVASVGGMFAQHPDLDITAIVYDSRKVAPGVLFVAVPGFHVDGFAYVERAIAAGAAAVVVDAARDKEAQAYAEVYPQVVFVGVPDVRAALAHLAARIYDNPSTKMGVIGITGTDGKTTTTFLTSAILDAAGYTTGLVGTVAFKIGGQWWDNPTRQTTLEPPETQSLLYQMLREGVQYAVVESSSHALALHKLLDVDFDVAALTNVTSEHLDFHGTVEEYRRAKSLLFVMVGDPKERRSDNFWQSHIAVVNRDDPNAPMFVAAARARNQTVTVYTYGNQPPNAADALPFDYALTATDIEADAHGTRYTLRTSDGRQAQIALKIPGDFNVHNSMAAACIGLSQGISLEKIAAGLANVAGVPGRMETIAGGQPFAVIVDYAHTAESLAKVLRILRPLTRGRLIVVFGSAGERDRQKRPAMGGVAAELADLAVFTNEDPRLEDEAAILQEIAAGAAAHGWRDGTHYWMIADRHAAIAHAFSLAQPGDTVLLAGKGHEQSIIVGTAKTPYDEREAARAVLRTMGYTTSR